jgi:hypothetical protein
MPLEGPELLGESDLLVLGELLVPEAQQVMSNEGVVDSALGRLVERLAQIESHDGSTKHRR